MVDKNIESFENIKNSFESKKRKKSRTLSCARFLDTFDIKKARDLLNKGNPDKLTQSEKDYVLKIAKKMLNANIESFGVCYGYYVVMGAEFCERLGFGRESFVKKKLLSAFKKHPDLFDHGRVEGFFHRNREDVVKLKNPFSKLVSKINWVFILAFIYFALGGFILTGNATGSFELGQENSYSSILGSILMFLGLLGFFVIYKKKNS